MQNKDLDNIKENIQSILPDSQIILFGSYARGDYDKKSDYDILVIVKENLSTKDKRYYASLIAKKLAAYPLDIIVKTQEDAINYSDKTGSIVKEALNEGIII